MAVRITALQVETFKNGGLEVGVGWVAHEKLNDRQRATLRDFHGRFIQVHPHDRDNLRELGLAFVDPHKPLEDLEAKKPEKPDAPAAPKTKDPKTDAGKPDAKTK